MSRSINFHRQRSLARQLIHLSRTVQILLLNHINYECSVQTAKPRERVAVSACSERRILQWASRRTEQFLKCYPYSHKCASRNINSVDRNLVRRSLWASLRSLAPVNINVVMLSLNGNSLSSAATCVAFHSSLVSGSSGFRSSWLLLRGSSFSRATSAWQWFYLRVSLMLFRW